MKHNRFIPVLAAIAMLALLPVSCSKLDDVQKHGATAAGAFYSNDGECLEGLSAIYHYFENWAFYYYWPIINMMADDCYTGGGQRGNDAAMEELNEFRYTAANSHVTNLFKQYYTIIYRCNLLISHIPEDTASAIQKRCRAEALVIRAQVYLRLVSLYGKCPLLLEEVTDAQYAKPAAEASEVYAQIEQDLQTAINSGALLEKSSVGDKVVNVTKQTAQAILGKAYVFESTFLGTDKWSEARSALEAVIGSGKYALVDIAHYNDQFHMDGHFSTESLFETNRLFDSQNMAANYNCHRLGWRTEKFKVAQLSAAQAAGITDFQPASYGFYNPSKELYDAFVAMEGEDGARLNRVITTYRQLNEIPLQVETGKNIYGCAGYFQNKLMPRANEYMSTHKTSQNYVIMRYAEVLLLAAEAQLPAHGGNQSLCDKYMDQIKERAGIADRPGGYTLEDIQKEKRLELCYEGTRYPDLLRWGIASTVLADWGKRVPSLYGMADGSDNDNELNSDSDGYNVKWYETGSSGFQPRHKVLPIPQSEIDVNQQITQNEGWN